MSLTWHKSVKQTKLEDFGPYVVLNHGSFSPSSIISNNALFDFHVNPFSRNSKKGLQICSKPNDQFFALKCFFYNVLTLLK